LQMLIYLAAIAESTEWNPAGILYMPAAVGSISAEKGTQEDKLAKEVSAKLKMNGLLQEDPDLLLAMDGTGSGTYLPTGIKNGAADKPEAVVNEKDMALVLSYVKYKVGEMAEELIAGKIPAAPLLVNKNPCGWCPYAGVCLKEYTDEDVRTEKALNKESLEEIRAEFGEEETHGA
ncbi:MAG: PD-(D/E)XK nuclease family protein, partial [Clostridia bacterium]|nr:PD-(D/E)XK nuclease family protein [Clostridia bacterium]